MHRKDSKIRRHQLWGLIFISPWIIGFAVFQLFPLLDSLYYSFTNYNPLKGCRFIGIDNYVKMFCKDNKVIPSMLTTLLYVLMSVPAKILSALLIALLLNRKIRGIHLFRTVYYLPSIFGGSVAISILWRFLFKSDGVVNHILEFFHIAGPNWLGSPKTALLTVSLVSVWQFGSSMVLFLAGLKQIPAEMYESARVDGSTSWKSFFKITLPFLSPVIFFNLLMQLINAFQEFTLPFVITNGGPANATYLYSMMIYDNAFQYLNMGYASAESWVLFLIMAAVTAVIFKSSSVWVFYKDGA